MDHLYNSNFGNSGAPDWLNTLGSELEQLMDGAGKCAFIGFPDQRNPGDSALWVGGLRLLDSIGVKVVYTCCHRSYSRNDLVGRLPEGPIVINGGGNLGDMYMDEENLRRAVLRDFPSRRIVQLPQTVYFRSLNEAMRIAPLYAGHRGLRLMVRENESRKWLKRRWSLPSVLAPDAALTLNGIKKSCSPDTDVFCLLRADAEGRSELRKDAALAGFDAEDWIGRDSRIGMFESKTAGLEQQYDRLVDNLCHERGLRRKWALSRASVLRSRLAEQRLKRGCRILSRGCVVITDRLHGHILSFCMGIPNVLIDNNYGKNRAVYESWTAGCPGVAWADSFQEAADLTKTMTRVSPE
ncbi:MAG: polysaccharide pyruvyl transferase family protein [Verrucomicrobiota bacterium]